MFRLTSTAQILSFSALAFLTLTGFLSLFIQYFQPQNAILFEPFLNAGPCTFSADTADLLTRSAREYLQKTSDILGSRFNPEFYQSAVQAGFENLTVLPEQIKKETVTISESVNLITFFDFGSFKEDTALQETLTFLNDLEPAPDTEPVFLLPVNLAGNPLDEIGTVLTEPLSPSCRFFAAADRISRRALTFSELSSVLFSLLSITASLLTPGSRILVLFGTEHSSPDHFFSELKPQFTVLIAHLFPQTKSCLFSGFMRTSIRISQIEERKTIVLLR